ncbi:DNA-directed RNA polymerase I subunit RPA2 [Lagopus muta]|uniref:DNA-directed RNA polymerase I subunit RPA2 n=1 Tax=Lagopus muta TaxID=64668 RepID=UPI00209CDA46|nr:DNA-directed RNA polymerase I subunit RPA2 [Lagopus muta]
MAAAMGESTSRESHRLRRRQRPRGGVRRDLPAAHIESFNYAISEGVYRALQDIPPVELALKDDRVALTVVGIAISPPVVPKGTLCQEVKVFPAECRGLRSTYRGRLTVDISWSLNGIPQGTIKQPVGYIPIMVKSKLCNLYNLSPQELIQHHEEEEEMGGYFIINGLEKVIRMLIMPRRNFPLAMTRHKWKNRGPGFTEYGVVLHCVKDEHSAINMNLHYLENGCVMVNFIFQKELFFLPLGFALKALVNFTDYQIFEELVKDKKNDTFYVNCVTEMLRAVAEAGCYTQQNVLEYLGKSFRVKLNLPEWYSNEQAADFIFNKCICIHLTDRTEKFYLLCMMTRKLYAFAKGECMEDNPDSLMNQEVLTAGQLFLMFLKERLENWLQSVKFILEKRTEKADINVNTDSLMKAFSLTTDVTKSFEYLLATGNLRSKTGLGMLQDSGLCVVGDKLNFVRYLSHFRCIHRGSAFAQMRTTTVRKLLPESWGFLCPVDTPDGEPCGLMNHMTAVCEIVTEMVPVTDLPPLLCALGVVPIDATPSKPYAECYRVVLDGAVVGWVEWDLAPQVAEALRRFKITQEKRFPARAEVVLIPMTGKPSLYPGLFIFTTPCRMVRPVKNLLYGRKEWIGTLEQVFMNVATMESDIVPGVTTHQELFPHSILSVVANLIPFSDHNQSPRNMYQCQMGKQTMGFPVYNYRDRSDNKLYLLHTPQSPLVRPRMYDYYGMDSYPVGTNSVVAVISYSGYDMEDAMIVNKSSWERGFAYGSVIKMESIDLSLKASRGGDNLVFGIRPGDPNIKEKLDADGLPFVGSILQPGDPFYSYMNLNTGETFTVYYQNKEVGIVDNIKLCSNDRGTGKFKKACITVRVPRNPTVGDKFASRHGQKGILSQLWPVEDMPFTENGMVPDILFNPHGFPSRMTIGMLIESMAGKSAALHGAYYDATPFTFTEKNSALKYFGETLVSAGYNFFGTEKMYSGISGVELEADIFVGVVYYQRLRHMVSDKFQVRTTGPRDSVTNQPVKGRNVEGGIRFGEMERDALLAHGTSFLLHDRLFSCSDGSEAYVCTSCGSMLSPLLQRPPPSSVASNRRYSCMLCGRMDTIQVIPVPHVFRYFLAELAAMNIKLRLTLEQ